MVAVTCGRGDGQRSELEISWYELRHRSDHHLRPSIPRMNIDPARKDASEMVKALATRLDETHCIADCQLLAGRTRKLLENVRKKYQRIIDERLLPPRRFAIHEREAIQALLNRLVSETELQIEALVSTRQKRIAESSGEREPPSTRVSQS